MKQLKTKIISNKKVAPEHYILSFRAKKIAESALPGQFFNVRINNTYKPLLRRPFGIHKIDRDKIEILYKVIGGATNILSSKKKGDTLDIIGPLGNGFYVEKKENKALLVAGGHGIAPLYALAKKLKSHGLGLSVFIGARTKNHVVCDKELKKLKAKVYIATEDGSKGHKGFITELLQKKLREAKYKICDTIYACGPKQMLKAVAKIAKQYKIPAQVSLEEYIACGFGSCLGCAVKTKDGYRLVCKDGPVFDTKEIIW